MAAEATDSNELASFGYKQELDRSLGSFSSFAAGFSYISILTGVFQLFAFGFAFGGPGGVVDVADRLHRPDVRRPVLRRARGPVSAGRLGLPVVQAHRQRLHVVDGGLDHGRRLDRDGGRGGRRLAGHPAAGLDLLPDPRRQGRRGDLPDQGRRAERDPPGRDPRRLHDDREHDRRQADGADQQRRRDPRAHRRDAADRPARSSTSAAGPTSCSRPSASARATSGATSAPSSSAAS